MIASFLIQCASLTAAFLAGMRCATVLREQRRTRRGGTLDLTGCPLPKHWKAL